MGVVFVFSVNVKTCLYASGYNKSILPWDFLYFPRPSVVPNHLSFVGLWWRVLLVGMSLSEHIKSHTQRVRVMIGLYMGLTLGSC